MGLLRETARIIWGYRNTLIVLLVPALSSPLLAVNTGPAKGGWIVIIMATYWITEALPLAVTALLPLILYPLLGILDMDVVSRIYFKDTMVLFFGSMVLAVTIEEQNVHKRIALRTLLVMGSKPRWLMLGFMMSTAFLSMWIANTAITAMMVPIAHAIVEQITEKRRELEVTPGSGKTDYMRCPTSEVDKKTEESNDTYGNPSVFGHEEQTGKDEEDKTHLESANDELDEESLADSKETLSKALLLSIAYSASIGGVTTLTGTGSTIVFKGVTDELYGEEAGITYANWMYFMFPMTILSLLICWIWLQFFFLDRRCCLWARDCRCCTQETDEARVVHELIQREYNALGPDQSLKSNNIPLLIFPSKMPWFIRRIFGKVDPDEKAGPVEPLITWKSAQRKFPWDIFILLGGGFALAQGCEESGLSRWLAELFSALSDLPSWLIVLILSTTLCIFTEITSNVAVTMIFLPVCASLSERLCINPLYLMIPVTIACANAFMLPAAAPPNAIVFSYGNVSILDMMKAGLFQNVVGITLTNILINTMGIVVYDVLAYPSWVSKDACNATTPTVAE